MSRDQILLALLAVVALFGRSSSSTDAILSEIDWTAYRDSLDAIDDQDEAFWSEALQRIIRLNVQLSNIL